MPIPRSYLSTGASPAGRASRTRAFYTGYVAERDLARRMQSAEGRDEVVVSVGGGAVGAPLLEAAIAARPQDGAGRPALAAAARRRICRRRDRVDARAASEGIVVEPARADFTTLLRNAALSISQAGYNTVDRDPVLRRSRRAGAVRAPSARPSRPTAPRLLAERGMVASCRPARCRRNSLADAVAGALAGPSLRSFPPCDVERRRRRRRRCLHRLLVERAMS